MLLKPSEGLTLAMVLVQSSLTNWAALGLRILCCSVTILLDWVSILVTTPRMLVLVALVRRSTFVKIGHKNINNYQMFTSSTWIEDNVS